MVRTGHFLDFNSTVRTVEVSPLHCSSGDGRYLMNRLSESFSETVCMLKYVSLYLYHFAARCGCFGVAYS